jgi:hypothetical protein
MQFLVMATIAAVLSVHFLVRLGVLPGVASYAPELLAVVAAAVVVVVGVKNRFQFVRPAYWLVFVALVVLGACSVVVNSTGSGPIFAGLRTYLRALPFFFLPAVIAFTDRRIRAQLMLLLALSVVQFPLAWYQRSNEQFLTGDTTVGTLGGSGTLTMFMVCAACVLTAFYLRKRIGNLGYVLLLLWILAPTMINETKVTLVLLPMALLATFYVGSKKGTRLKNTLLGLVVLGGLLSIFVPVYDHYMRPRWGYGILDFLTMEGRVEGYLVRNQGVGSSGKVEAGRLDGVFAAVEVLSTDPTKLFFGVGIGNASDSALGAQFVGAYYKTFELLPVTSFTAILLEHGLCGLALVLLLHWLIFRDSVMLARRPELGITSIVAVAWTGVSLTVVLGLLYSDVIQVPALSYLYWYFSGLIAAARMRAALESAAPARVGSRDRMLVAQRG